jgi:hypothetical protein
LVWKFKDLVFEANWIPMTESEFWLGFRFYGMMAILKEAGKAILQQG